jgi:hypothetical protein
MVEFLKAGTMDGDVETGTGVGLAMAHAGLGMCTTNISRLRRNRGFSQRSVLFVLHCTAGRDGQGQEVGG